MGTKTENPPCPQGSKYLWLDCDLLADNLGLNPPCVNLSESRQYSDADHEHVMIHIQSSRDEIIL